MIITKELPRCDTTVETAIKSLVTLLATSSTPRLDAQVLLSHVMGRPRAWLLANGESSLTGDEKLSLDRVIKQAKKGIPLPYIIGHWEFYGLDFHITPDVLIPRPETELLVEYADNWLTGHPNHLHALDLGTGSGCIAVSLAYQHDNLKVTAIDISPAALKVARINAIKHQVDNQLSFILADLLDSDTLNHGKFPPPFDIILANLPYIPTPILKDLGVYEKEPTLALNGGPDGFGLIGRFLTRSIDYLSPGGIILLEIDASQKQTGMKLAKDIFPDSDVNVHPDYAGKDRLLVIRT